LNLRSASPFLDPVTARERRKPLKFVLVLLLLVWAPAICATLVGAALAAAVDVKFNAPGQGYLTLLEARLLSAAVTHNRDLGLVAKNLPTLFYVGSAAGLLLLFASRRAGRSPRTFLTAWPRVRWRLIWTAMGVTAACYLAGLSLGSYVGVGSYEPVPGWREAGLWRAAAFLVCIPPMVAVMATAEEVIFRGWLLQQTAAFTRWAPVLLGVSALSFAFMHNSNEWQRAVQLGLGGAALAWATLRSGGIETACGCHVATNLSFTFLDRDRAMATVLDANGATVGMEVGSALPTPVEWAIWWLLALTPVLVVEVLQLRDRLLPEARVDRLP